MADWTVNVTKRSTNPDGTAEITADLLDAGQEQGTLSVLLTAGRVLTVTWSRAPGAAGLAGFQAWES